MIHTLYVTGMHLFATVYSFVGQFSLRAHNSSHLYFSAPISCSMPIVKNLWDIPYYTMLYYLDIIALITLLQLCYCDLYQWYIWISIFSLNTWLLFCYQNCSDLLWEKIVVKSFLFSIDHRGAQKMNLFYYRGLVNHKVKVPPMK